MNERQLYITRPPEGGDLYTDLQRKTLADLQRLSGEVWTDYNPSDSGVTIADAANYVLTEFDYKLDFALEDYLADKEDAWAEERYGFFPSEVVYPSTPVTVEDYRRSILTRFPMVENVKVLPKENGWYNVTLRLSPFSQNDRGIENKVRGFLNRHRNLCEQFGVIETEQPEELFFHADFGIENGQDAIEILVQIYWRVMQYLSGTVEIVRPASDGLLSMREDEWYEGPVKEIRAEIPEQKDTENELYWKLKSIPGIVSFNTCYLKSRAGHIVTDFKKGYLLHIPESFGNVTVRIGREKVDADIKDFLERLRARYFMRDTFRMRRLMQEWEERSAGIGHDKRRKTEEDKGKETLYHSAYRDVYDHSPLANDLPSCYGTSEKDFLRNTPPGQKADVRNFGNYLKLFDLLMERGLNELDGLKRVLSIDDADKGPSCMETLPEEVFAMRKQNDRYRDIEELRNRYMDFLDGLYGVDGAQEWLAEFDCYGQTVDDRMRRRIRFLKSLPKLIRDRPRSFDLTGTYGGENVPTVKKYLSLLLDFDIDEETTVGNILPGHNLILMGNGEKGEWLRGLMSSQMIDDDVFVSDSVEAIKEDTPPATKAEKLKRNEDLRRNLPIFNSNWISGSLFRQGIALCNYNLVEMGYSEWLLVFRGKEGKYMNLGRSDSKEKLTEWANTLCRYLRELNKLCEAVYVVEKSLFTPAEPFTVMLVFTGWTARTRSPRFREECTRLARSVVPAHLRMETCWVDALQMQYFEDGYKKWRESIRENAPEDIRAGYLKKMTDALSKEDGV